MIRKYITSFFKNLHPETLVHSPSRINLINPLDAVEGDFWMPAAAIEGKNYPLSVWVYIKKALDTSVLKVYELIYDRNNTPYITIKEEKPIDKSEENLRVEFQGDFKLIYASFYRISQTNKSLWEEIKDSHFELGILSTIPRQSGLGGSSSIILAILYGFADYFNYVNKIDNLNHQNLPINKDILAEMCTKVEDEDLNITAGYGDRYVIARGGLSFCSYYGKLYHKQISQEPLAVYDRIDQTYNIDHLPIIVCFSGSTHESGDVHQRLRRLYLENDQEIVQKYYKLAEISWRSRFSLMNKDWKDLGTYFKQNTKLMNEIMQIAKFEYGIGLANNILINIIEEHPEVYAAKLTGAGGGGSVFALVNPNKEVEVLHFWKKKLEEVISDSKKFKMHFPNYPEKIREDLKRAQFFQIKINKTGVKSI